MKLVNVINKEYINPVDLETLGNSINTLQAGHIQALDKANELKVALSAFDLNPQEDAWKQEKVNEINQLIDDNTIYGNAYQALDDIIRQSGDLLTSPALIKRAEANANYKAFRDSINARTDLTEREKQYFLDNPNNQYYYEDKFDDYGRVIGGTTWIPGENPTQKISVADSFVKAIQLAAKEAGGTGAIKYIDANGNEVTDLTQAKTFMVQNSTDYKWERLTDDKIQQAWNFILNSEPGLKESIAQDYKIESYYYDKAQKDGTTYIGNVVNQQGLKYNSIEEYAQARINPGIDAAKYYNAFKTVNSKFIDLRTNEEKKGKSSKTDDNYMPNMGASTQTHNINYTNAYGKDVFTTKETQIGNISQLYKQYTGKDIENPESLNIIQWKDKIGELRTTIANSDSIDKNYMLEALNNYELELEDAINNYNKFISSEGDKELFDFIESIETTGKLPLNNKYNEDAEFAGNINKIWTNGIDANGTQFNTAYLSITSNNDAFKKELQRYGFDIRKGDYKNQILISSSDKDKTIILSKLIKDYNVANIIRYNENFKIISPYTERSTGTLDNPPTVYTYINKLYTYYNSLKNKQQTKLKEKTNSRAIPNTVTVYTTGDAFKAQQALASGEIDEQRYNTTVKIAKEQLAGTITSADFSQASIYMYDENDKGGYKPITKQKDLVEIQQSFRKAIISGNDKIKVNLVSNDLDGAGYTFSWIEGEGANAKEYTIYSPDLYVDRTLKELQTSDRSKAVRNLTLMDTGMVGSEKTIFDDGNGTGLLSDVELTALGNGTFYLTNGENSKYNQREDMANLISNEPKIIDKETAVNMQLAFKNLRMAKLALQTPNILTDEQISNYNTIVANAVEYIASIYGESNAAIESEVIKYMQTN